MSKTLLACVGGFLGAGKTTSLQKAAAELQRRGRKVVVIVNDQGGALVDTHAIRSTGTLAEEIVGGCFCCKFDDFADTLVAIREREQPDVVLAEAVGSCTDLIATVYRPLLKFHAEKFDLAPLSVLVEADRFRALAASAGDDPMRYLFHKQIEEAGLVVLSKCDTLRPEERAALLEALAAHSGSAPVHCMSARTGEGIAAWIDLLLRRDGGAEAATEVDYDTYAAAEAALAWLNATASVDGEREFSPREFAESFMKVVQDSASSSNIAIAHIKALVDGADGSDRVAMTDNVAAPQWTGVAEFSPSRKVSLIINARVRSTPEQLTALIDGSLRSSSREYGAGYSIRHIECFSPQRPTPRYRFTNA